MANQIASDLPDGWTNIVFGMLRTKQEGEEYLVYYSPDEGRNWYDLLKEKFEADADMDGLEDAMDTAREIFDLCSEEGDSWSTMTFRMDNCGKFHAGFGYEMFSHINDAIRQSWRKKELHG